MDVKRLKQKKTCFLSLTETLPKFQFIVCCSLSKAHCFAIHALLTRLWITPLKNAILFQTMSVIIMKITAKENDTNDILQTFR